jgi:hypothetical protein
MAEALSLRHACLVHAIADTFPLREKSRIIAHRDVAPSSNGECRINPKSRPHGGPRVVHSARSPHWVKVKNPAAPAVKREAEEDWS